MAVVNGAARYAVMGNPIAHSKSPQIHTLFAEQTGQALTYEAILVEIGQFPEAVTRFRDQGGQGLNVTVPFKQDAWKLAMLRSAAAERAGAVNTLYWDEQNRLCGENTDGIGLVRDLTVNHGLTLKGKRILVLGAGGAVRGVLQPLLSEHPLELVIANRTVSKAQTLAEDFGDLGRLSACGFDELAGRFDVIINGTAAGLSGEVPPIPTNIVDTSTVCYDMVYGAEPTAFVRWAQAQGAKQGIDGLGMLVEQAAEAFRIWRGVRPDTAPVMTALRNA